jgi:PAS domain S-box-containing protein
MLEIKSARNNNEWFKDCFDSAYEGIVVVDKNAIIRMYNDAYCRFVGIKKDLMIGKHINEVVLDSGLPFVLKTGIPERNYIHVLQGQQIIVHRIPIRKHGEVCGAIGILISGISEIYELIDRMQNFKGSPHSTKNNILCRKLKQREKTITFDQIIGESMTIVNAKEIASRAAKTPATILITGESGVGKELFAKSIHYLSDYRDGPFISINCASIPENLLESELFGYVEGAFTGAQKYGKLGKFELAHKGTLLLDEIGDMSLHMQSKILRVLQEREVDRLGGTKTIPIDFRLIAATNRSLEKMVKEKTFREDLFYRLNVIWINIPCLRERKTDIPLLIVHFLQKICEKFRIPQKKIDEKAMVTMMNYSWPGNIRELVNVIEQLVTLVEGSCIYLNDLPSYLVQQKSGEMNKEAEDSLNSRQLVTAHKSIFQMAKEASLEREKILIIQSLIEEGGNKTYVAKKLGISRATLYKKITKLGIY